MKGLRHLTTYNMDPMYFSCRSCNSKYSLFCLSRRVAEKGALKPLMLYFASTQGLTIGNYIFLHKNWNSSSPIFEKLDLQ